VSATGTPRPERSNDLRVRHGGCFGDASRDGVRSERIDWNALSPVASDALGRVRALGERTVLVVGLMDVPHLASFLTSSIA